ncbi:hypothetical protein [Arthrobacter sp. AQ5-05]|uniref:hypothetical protein n=1 Tax=Arthrobacter sp. AQ5-05 TaxID=2184581 RepID=UPI0012B51BDF|nr:hypothetical protein [Arthrobacter sp. AQ5-05]
MTYQIMPEASVTLKNFQELRAGAGSEATAKAVDIVEDKRTTDGKRHTTTVWYCLVYEFTNAHGDTNQLMQRIKCSKKEPALSSFPEVPVVSATQPGNYDSYWNSDESQKELSATSGNYVIWFYASIAAFVMTIAGIIWILRVRSKQKRAARTASPVEVNLP